MKDNHNYNLFKHGTRWFNQTPERALDQAYRAALRIKEIENKYFQNKSLSYRSGGYFKQEVNKQLFLIKIKIAEFKVSSLFFLDYDSNLLDKLQFVEEVVNEYSNQILVSVTQSTKPEETLTNVKPITQKTGILPSSISRTVDKVKQDLNPNSEEQLVQNFRNSRRITRKALRTIIILIFVPVLVQIATKNLIFLPMLEHNNNKIPMFLNEEIKEKAIEEMHFFEEELKFKNFLEDTSKTSPEDKETLLSEKVQEIASKSYENSINAISNSLADLAGIVSFIIAVILNNQGIIAIKSFMNEIVYGLSDSAKAFIIILCTDVFVGFHSPHGWEVLLEGLSSHLGLPANRNLIFLFIATFPVILDTIFKYWIFRYLNQISPSAVATLKNMNE